MTTYNKSFAKLTFGTLSYGPVPLVYLRHRHEEYDVPVFDPETGEPVVDPETGGQRTEHVVRDWDELVVCLFPSAADYREAGYLPVRESWFPEESPDEGYHWERTGRYVQEGEGDGAFIRPDYVQAADPEPAPPAPRTFSILQLEAAIFQAGLSDRLDAFLDNTPVENQDGGTTTLRRFYDRANDLREDHPMFARYLSAAKAALGVDDETAAAILDAATIQEA